MQITTMTGERTSVLAPSAVPLQGVCEQAGRGRCKLVSGGERA